jgi:hypothetical protein
MALNDPFACKHCYGQATYKGRLGGESIYRCQCCGAENRVSYRLQQQQQQQQQQPHEPGKES